MVVNRNTRISAIIKADKNAIDIITSIHPNFNKLRNPVLRKLLAPRVKVGDAAKIGGVSVNTFLKKLQEGGFEVDYELDKDDVQEINQAEYDDVEVDNEIVMDVRPILSSGTDPFKQIMETVKKVEVGESLRIINSFEPIPLIHKLEKKGFTSRTMRLENGEIHCVFTRIDDSIEGTTDTIPKASEAKFDDVYKSFIGRMDYIDVRSFEMPEPMTKILAHLESQDPNHCLLVDHKKNPQFLLPILESRGFSILYNSLSETHIQLLIFKERK